MACNGCGRGQVLRVERAIATSNSSRPRHAITHRFSNRKMLGKTIAIKPTNIDRHRA